MELIEIDCNKCKYKTQLLIGSNSPDQTFSDLNEDFADYKVYLCPEGKEYYSHDHHDRDFDKTCPIHHVELKELDKLPAVCPKCGDSINIKEKDMVSSKLGE